MTKQNYIAGSWTDGSAANENINPSDTNDVVGHYAAGTASDVVQAVDAAHEALAAWSAIGIQGRADLLDIIGQQILDRRQELGQLLAREEGKTLPEAIGETVRAGQIFKFFAGEAIRPGGELADSVRPGLEIMVSREPVGVIGVITPWNFPIAIPAWKIAPALAFGNTVVFKPAELVPGCAHALAEIIHEAGIPKGVFNLVMGAGSVVGDAIVNNARVKAISFTGSVETGQGIAVKAAERLARIQLEMGGKNPLVVLDDADMDTAVNCAIQGAFYSTGQRCTASSRLIVTKGIHDRFLEALKLATENLVVDHALKQGSQIGPVVDQRQLEQNLSYLDIGRKEGATLLCGGQTLERETPGYYMAPALFANMDPAMRINREEIFGPVASVIVAGNYAEALQLANDTEFGLSSGIVTSSLKYASDFRKNARAGMVMINVPTAGVDYHVPFGGTKGSSYGSREQGTYAREFYTSVKTSYVLSG